MDKFSRNIEQLEEKGIDPKLYFIEKGVEEAREWIKALEDYRDCLVNHVEIGEEVENNLLEESADVGNIVIYLIALNLFDWSSFHDMQELKQDIAYNRIEEG